MRMGSNRCIGKLMRTVQNKQPTVQRNYIILCEEVVYHHTYI